MKKLGMILFVLLVAMTTVFAAGAAETKDVKTDGITIGVSTWSINDSLGSQVRGIIDAAASALDVKVVYIEQSHKSEEVVASVENLCASGVDGIIICNSADAEMARAITIAQKNKVHIAQFFRIIGDPEIEKIALKNSYYLGCTHEDETANGYELGRILVEDKNCRNIGMTSYRVGDATANARMIGYKQSVADWNKANPNDQAVLMNVVDDKYSSEESRQAVEGMIDANPTMDGLIVVGGGGQALEGALAAVKAKNLTGRIHVASTDFTTNLEQQLANNEISAMSGGHFADPFFSFIMVYNAIKGNYSRPADEYLEVIFPMMFVASAEDYRAFNELFIESLPYNKNEIVKIANGSFENLQNAAKNLSIEDVKQRHQK